MAKTKKKYQLVIGPFNTKKEAARELLMAKHVISDLQISIKEQSFIIYCGIYDKKDIAETIKNKLKSLNVKIISK